MELGRLTAVFDADTRKFDAGIRGVQSKIGGVTTGLGRVTTNTRQLTSVLDPAGSGLTGFATRMGVVAGVAVIGATAIGGIATGLFSLIKSSAEAGGELFDLSQKTNFTVETLSALSIVARTTDSDIKSISASLGIFQKNQDAAADSNSKQGKLFRSLNIDINDNEKALRQAFTQLNKMGDGTRQTAVAMQLFGRSGKDVLAIVKETNGNLDQAIAKYDKMGLIISSSAATASDKFNDVLEETTLQLSAVTRSIGTELLPVATEALQSISFWLAENKGQWSAWGSAISDIVRGVTTLLQSEVGTMIGYIAKLGLTISGIGGVVGGLARLGQSERPGEDIYGPGGAMRGGRKTLPGTSEYEAAQRRLAGLAGGGARVAGGGGGGGGGSKKKDELEALKRVVIDLNNDFRKLDVELFNSANLTLLAAEKEKILTAVMGSLSDAAKKTASQFKDVDEALDFAISKLPKKSQVAAEGLRQEALAQFKKNEETRIAGELTKQTEALAKDWRQEIENTRSGADQYTVAIQQLEKAYAKYGLTLPPTTKAELEQAAAMQRTLATIRELTRERIVGDRPRRYGNDQEGEVQNLGGGSFLMEGGTGQGRERIATVDEQVTRERMQIIREQMADLAHDLTGMLDRALYDGIKGGGMRGLQSLSLGFLDMIQEIVLGRLKTALAEALTAGASGSGLLGKLLGFFIPDLPAGNGRGKSIPWPTSATTGAGSTRGDTTATRQRTVTPRDVDSQTRQLISATTSQTQALSNQIQLTGQQIVMGLTPVQEGFWAGLIKTTIGGALNGLVGSLTGGIGGGGEDWSNEGSGGSRPTTAPTLQPFRPQGSRAAGGPVSAGSLYRVNEDVTEYLLPLQPGHVYNQSQVNKMGKPSVTNIYNIQLPPMPPGSYKSPASQRELANKLLAALQGAQT